VDAAAASGDAIDVQLHDRAPGEETFERTPGVCAACASPKWGAITAPLQTQKLMYPAEKSSPA
jgi:hypothetical protein